MHAHTLTYFVGNAVYTPFITAFAIWYMYRWLSVWYMYRWMHFLYIDVKWLASCLVVVLPEVVTSFFTCVAKVEPTRTTVPVSGTSLVILLMAIKAVLPSCFGRKVVIANLYRRWRRDRRSPNSLPAAVCPNQFFCNSDTKFFQLYSLVYRVRFP